MSNLKCSTCGKTMDDEGIRNIVFQAKSEGEFILKDFRLVHKGVCDIDKKEEGWLDCWIASWNGATNSKAIKEILKNLNDYDPETKIEGSSLIRVLAQFYED